MWYILFAMIHQQDYTAYQTYALLDFNISFEKDIPADDILRAVIEVTERIDINKFVDFTHRNSHGGASINLVPVK